MSALKIFAPIGRFLANHKFKLVGVVIWFLLFCYLLFPFEEISDVISSKITSATNGAWYVQFDDFDFRLWPGSTGVQMRNVLIENATLPAIKADTLAVTPWILGAITGRQGASLDVNGLFGGFVVADYREGDKLKSGEREKRIAVDIEKLKLPQLTRFLREGGLMKLTLKGDLHFSSQIQIDPVFDNQPKGTIDAEINEMALPAQSLLVNFNGVPLPLPLPEMKLGLTHLLAKISDGNVELNSLKISGKNNDISGEATGLLGLRLRRDNFGVNPQLGSYDLRLNLTFKRDFVNANEAGSLGLVFNMIRSYRRETATGYQYAFRIKGDASSSMPQISAAQ